MESSILALLSPCRCLALYSLEAEGDSALQSAQRNGKIIKGASQGEPRNHEELEANPARPLRGYCGPSGCLVHRPVLGSLLPTVHSETGLYHFVQRCRGCPGNRDPDVPSLRQTLRPDWQEEDHHGRLSLSRGNLLSHLLGNELLFKPGQPSSPCSTGARPSRLCDNGIRAHSSVPRRTLSRTNKVHFSLASLSSREWMVRRIHTSHNTRHQPRDWKHLRRPDLPDICGSPHASHRIMVPQRDKRCEHMARGRDRDSGPTLGQLAPLGRNSDKPLLAR